MSSESISSVFTDRLVKMLQARNMSKRGLAKKANVGIHCIQDWSKGRGVKRMEVISDVAKALDVSTDYLFGLSDNYYVNNDSNDVMKAAETIKKYCKDVGICTNSCVFFNTEEDGCKITQIDMPEYWRLHD